MKKLLNASDKTAIASSFVCVLHCIALPLILIFLPSVSGLIVFSDERFHLWLVIAVAPISIFAITTGYFHHRRTSIFFISAIGMLILLSAAIFGHDTFGEKGEVIVTLIGSVLIAFGHISNFRLRRATSYESSIELN
jgi:drug/metabolite transporter (DMT)-like permease